jgi:hypothetical protein
MYIICYIYPCFIHYPACAEYSQYIRDNNDYIPEFQKPNVL